MSINKIFPKLSQDDAAVGYIYLPNHPGLNIPNLVKKQIALSDLLKDYKGIPIYLDFNVEGELIGIEIVG